MALQEISAKTQIKEGDKAGQEVSGTIQYDFGDNLQDMVGKFGEDVVFTNARQQMTVQCQAQMRRELLTVGNVDRVAAEWKPGAQMRTSTDPFAAAKAATAGMSPDEKKAFMKNLMAAIG